MKHYYDSRGAAKELLKKLNLDREIKRINTMMRVCNDEEREEYRIKLDKLRAERNSLD